METKRNLKRDIAMAIRVLIFCIGAFSVMGIWNSFGWEMGARGIGIVILNLLAIVWSLFTSYGKIPERETSK